MSLPNLHSFPNLASRNLAVARWIHLVSQHPPWYVPQMAAPESNSNNELQPIPPPIQSLRDGLHVRAATWVQSDSDLRLQVEGVRLKDVGRASCTPEYPHLRAQMPAN
ncbi:hypothetical protein BDV93DRAFT_558615 [Ceratobasidium sp. AG-I]|nr:hypothetical protein BDV93DRAFT_558615 [Ceratobasidium sp. AG-I]